MRNLVLTLLTFSALIVNTGCATGAFMNTHSRYVKESALESTLVYTGGGAGAESMGSKDAASKMTEHCPLGYNVTEKGEYTANNTNVGSYLIQTKIPEKYVSFKCK